MVRTEESGHERGSESLLIQQLLTVASNRLGMELSWMSSFVDGNQVFDQVGGDRDAFAICEGDSSPLNDSYCVRVVDGRLPNIVHDTSQHPVTASLDVTGELGIGSYVGVPILMHDEVVGMLCCVSRGPATHLRDSDVRTLELLADLVGEISSRESPVLRRDREIADRVAAAIADSTLRTVYQPIVSMINGDVVGVEALSRFDGGPKRPDVWFAEASSVGLGIDLELAAIITALKGLDDLGPDMYMSLNASPATICDGRLLEILAQSKPARCVVEVTEHASVNDYESLGRALGSLRELGVTIAVDDVGAGFASLAHVLELQPSILKIDRSIVKGIHMDPARQGLAQAIIGVAKRLDATVVAEGVEVADELSALHELGIDHVQGFLIGRPSSLPPPACFPSAIPDTTISFVDTSNVDEDLAVRRFELAMLHSPVGMALVSTDGSFIHVNPAFATMLGRSERDFNDLTFGSITHPDDLGDCQRLVAACLSGESDNYRLEKRYQLPNGSTIWGDVSVVLVRSADGHAEYFIAQVQETTDRHLREHALTAKAATDHLTAIANRAAASEHLDQLIESSTPFGVLYCDLRNFKAINDTHGHRAGDHVLIAVAQRLAQITRTGDVVARWGGDEFLISVANPSPSSLKRLALRAAEAVARPISLHPSTAIVTPTITVGSAVFDPEGGETIDAVLHRADTDMYTQRNTAHGQPAETIGDRR